MVRETPDSTTIHFRPGRGWNPHAAGQWARIGVEIDGVRQWRSYSLSAAVGHDPAITVTAIGFVSTALARDTKVGDILFLDTPQGDFVLPEHPRPLLMLTAGSGLTPVMSMIRTLVPRRPDADVVLIHSARTRDEALFHDELLELADQFPGLTSSRPARSGGSRRAVGAPLARARPLLRRLPGRRRPARGARARRRGRAHAHRSRLSPAAAHLPARRLPGATTSGSSSSTLTRRPASATPTCSTRGCAEAIDLPRVRGEFDTAYTPMLPELVETLLDAYRAARGAPRRPAGGAAARAGRRRRTARRCRSSGSSAPRRGRRASTPATSASRSSRYDGSPLRAPGEPVHLVYRRALVEDLDPRADSLPPRATAAP